MQKQVFSTNLGPYSVVTLPNMQGSRQSRICRLTLHYKIASPFQILNWMSRPPGPQALYNLEWVMNLSARPYLHKL